MNHYAKLIQRLIGLHIESDVLMRGLRHILSSKDMSLADEAYVKSIGTIGENSSSKENGEKAGERGPCGSIWIANQSSRIWGEVFILKKSDHTVGTGTLESRLQHKKAIFLNAKDSVH